MSRKSLDENQPVIFKCALLITAFTSSNFTTRDVIFHVDLVKNLFRPSNHFADFNLQPLQIIRLFEKYASDHWAVVSATGKNKTFTLLPLGFFRIIESLVKLDYILPTSEAIFLQWMLENYGNFVQRNLQSDLCEEKRKHLTEYTSSDYVLKRQMELIDQGAKDMEYRILENTKLQAFLAICKGMSLGPRQTFEKLPSQYSYQLSHQRSFQSWLNGLPEDLQKFEYEKGVSIRQKRLYQRSLNALQSTRAFYERALDAHLPKTF